LSRRDSPFHLDLSAATHIGGKHANHDHFRYDGEIGLFAVAKGVAHLPAPRVAAETALDTLFDYVTDPTITPAVQPRERLERTLAHVHRRVREQAATDDHLRGMAASLACVMEKSRLLIVGHVGDCRVIRVRQGRVERLTVDHRRGTDPLVLSAPAASGSNDPKALTRAIGLGEGLAPEVCVEGLHDHDAILLVTAGLAAVLDDEAILAAFQRSRQAGQVANDLIHQALARSVPDNVTCVVGRWRPLLA
jgi:protein phosphatase